MAILASALVAVVILVGVLWVVIARDLGPTVADVVVAYELALARGDWSTLFDLSGIELRGEFDRDHFVAQHRAEARSAAQVATQTAGRTHVAIERETVTIDSALVFTIVETPNGARRNAVQCERRQTRWCVTGYAPVVS